MHMRDQRIIPFPPALIEALKSARRIVPDGVQALAIALEYETEENLLMNVGKSNLSVKAILKNFFGHTKYSTSFVIVDPYWRDPLNTQFKDQMSPFRVKTLQQFLFEALSVESNVQFPVFKTIDGNWKMSELVKYMEWTNYQMYIAKMMAIRTDTLYGDLIRHFISTGHIKSGRDIYSFIIQTLKTYKNSPDLNDEMYNSFTTSELLEDKFKGINWLDLQILKKYGYYKKTMPKMW